MLWNFVGGKKVPNLISIFDRNRLCDALVSKASDIRTSLNQLFDDDVQCYCSGCDLQKLP